MVVATIASCAHARRNEEMPRQPNLPTSATSTREGPDANTGPEPVNNRHDVVVADQCAPPDAGVKVVRPRLRLRALHLDPTVFAGAPAPRRHRTGRRLRRQRTTSSTNKPVDNSRSFRDAVMRYLTNVTYPHRSAARSRRLRAVGGAITGRGYRMVVTAAGWH